MAESRRKLNGRNKKKKQAKLKDLRRRSTILKRFFDASPGSWIYETAAVLTGVIAVFLLLSFCSEIISTRFARGNSWAPGREELSTSAMGPIGHVLGTILVGFFGWCGLLPGLWFSAAAFFFWHCLHRGGEKPPELGSRRLLLAGIALATVAASALAAIAAGESGGGLVGKKIAGWLVFYVGSGGGVLFCAAFLVLALGFVLQKSTGHLLGMICLAIMSGLRFALAAAPLMMLSLLWNTADWIARMLLRTACSLSPFLAAAVRRRKKAEPAMPAPKIHKRLREQVEVQSVEDRLDSAASEIVVERRSPGGTKPRTQSRRKKSPRSGPDRRPVVDPPYEPPSLSLLTESGSAATTEEDDNTLRQKSKLIELKLKDFGISGRVTYVHPGPVITLFEFKPAAGVKVGRIASLQDDLAMSLHASSIRIIAPIPGRGTVGVEVPNTNRDIVRLRDILESQEFAGSDSVLSVPIGKDISGTPVVVDIAKMPHLLMAGATGSGKSVSINAILVSLLYRATPAELGLILIDPKILELSVYEGIPHLRVPVVTTPRQARAVLEWAVQEMNRRYRLMQRYGVRSIDGYNQIARGESESTPEGRTVSEEVVRLEEQAIIEEGTVEKGEELLPTGGGLPVEIMQPLPKILIVIDELADLMLSVGREIEDLITRLAQKARASGIHLIVATQRPSVDVITGLIKANFPARVSFRVTSRIDSRTILDMSGADKLLGRGDMLLMLPGAEHIVRAHGAYVSDAEVARVVKAVKERFRPHYDQAIVEICEKALEDESGNFEGAGEDDLEYDAFYDKAVELVLEKRQASTSMIQRAFRIGYNRAARIIDLMEQEGVVGPTQGAKPREVLLDSIPEYGE
jgi:DNA segregation ATPase FtsK/SpoIIIE, S-DNA-T family